MLSAKQELAIKRAPQGKKEALRAAFLEQNKKTQRPVKGRGKGTGQYRAPQSQQGRAVQATPWARPDYQPHVRALGDRSLSKSDILAAFDARSDAHMPSIRPTAPYIVSRVTTVFKSTRSFHMFGFYRTRTSSTAPIGEWSNVIGVSDVAAATAVNANLNTRLVCCDLSGYGSQTQISPCAMTVRVTCTSQLTAAGGNAYMARVTSPMDLSNSASTWDDFGGRVTQYFSPDVVPAASMVLGARIMHSLPLDPEVLHEFTDVDNVGAPGGFLDVTWNHVGSSGQYAPAGMCPLVVYNTSGDELEFTVTTQYRTRFALNHPAASTHKTHKATSVPYYERAAEVLMSAGHTVAEGFGRAMGNRAAVAMAERLPLIAGV